MSLPNGMKWLDVMDQVSGDTLRALAEEKRMIKRLDHPAAHMATDAQRRRSRMFIQICEYCKASILRTELRAWGEDGPLFCKRCHEFRRINKLNPNDAKFEELYLHRPSQLAPMYVLELVKWIYDLGYPEGFSILPQFPPFAVPLLAELLVERGRCQTMDDAVRYIKTGDMNELS